MKPGRRKLLKAMAAVGLGSGVDALAQKPAEWLVLVYMNGKNNLAEYALEDFEEMASVGSTAAVSVVVQLGRPFSKDLNPQIHGGWSGVKRFRIEKDMQPTADQALVHVGAAGDDTANMGSPMVLDDFIAWGTANFPARRRMLVIWNHGQGWRFQSLPPSAAALGASRTITAEQEGKLSNGRIVGMYRSVSSDDDHRSILYNKQVQTLLEARAAKGIRFDIIAYDACLMSMVETAYSLRRCADYLVGSEELEPGAGWDHSILLKKLVAAPTMDSAQLASTIVRSYEERYADFEKTTMSAVRLDRIGAVSESISAVAQQLLHTKVTSYPALEKARASLRGFADYKNIGFSVDCETLFEFLKAGAVDPAVKAAAAQVVADMKSIVVANYASTRIQKDYSPRGLALYFPQTREDFYRDRDGGGYLRSTKEHPVDFVHDMDWSVLLKDYLKLT